MLENITIRDAAEEDLPAIVAIYNSTIPGRMVTADTSEISVDERKPWLEEHLANEHRPLWVAEFNGKICGWLSLETFYGRPAYQATAEISVYIDPDCRGKGIGSFLMRQIIGQCKNFRIKTLLAFIFGHNTPSLHLFQRFGFEKWGHLPKVAELDGIERDLVIMGKRVEK
ncbi:GNAT family N-acetyltransferase [Sporolactobacillus putidus]|uniref:N-acetyltransferase n=1 Tax=Sporolactobacillus putidus TaxID=492735 RepID=A0A917W420_9BACL|nr:GNAT family N-acetyltransferase [Sporolactobacillus putidus]GGL61286.1 N-acetyltransferase [Sporolactobacillus putidus]